KLAGSQIGGSQLTTAGMAKQFANEVKILSCQPDEYSLEGEQWGGGRGVFSYHLVDGLLGLADRNSDAGISLGELDRYLEEHVTPEAAPQRQIPVVFGNKAERLAAVVPDVVAKLKKNRLAQDAVFSKTESRSLENDVLAGADSVLFQLYRSFEKALESGAFFEPEGACADYYYQKLAVEPALSRLHNTMRRNYAAALQDDAQQVMNRFLKTEMGEITLSQKRQAIRYDKYPRCLERAAQLLGPQHYMYPVLQARRHFFDGYLSALVCKQTDSLLATKALEDFREALRWQPELPQAYWQMGLLFGYNLQQPDSADYYARQAIQMAPGWLLPYTNTAFLFSKSKQYDRAKWYLEQAREIDSTSVLVWSGLGTLYFNQQDFAAAEQAYRMAAQLDTQVAVFPYNLGWVYLYTGRPTEAEQAWYQAIQLDSTYDQPHASLGSLFIRQERYDEAEYHYLTAARLNPTAATYRIYLGILYVTMQRYSEAELRFRQAIQMDSTYYWAHNELGKMYLKTGQASQAEAMFMAFAHDVQWKNTAMLNMACVRVAQKRSGEAFEFLEEALKTGSDLESLESDTDLAPLRALPEWKALMKKYFPDKVKD
ncbi:MAG: tetratricopeptide repeat protein, partial [Saprospiraceae bacterium]|nr:tetratricopeptide repeat protein [Saprospiraceae bacterium]